AHAWSRRLVGSLGRPAPAPALRHAQPLGAAGASATTAEGASGLLGAVRDPDHGHEHGQCRLHTRAGDGIAAAPNGKPLPQQWASCSNPPLLLARASLPSPTCQPSPPSARTRPPAAGVSCAWECWSPPSSPPPVPPAPRPPGHSVVRLLPPPLPSQP